MASSSDKFIIVTTTSEVDSTSTILHLFSLYYAKIVGGVFLLIALRCLTGMASKLANDGVVYDKIPASGRAELRAYYFGCALALGFVSLVADQILALQVAAISMLGFCVARMISYVVDGVDTDKTRAVAQHVLFVVELSAGVVALLLLNRVLVPDNPDSRVESGLSGTRTSEL